MLWLSSEKPVPHAPIMSPRTAKVIAVATSAMQLAMNKRLLSAADRAAVPAPLACALKAGSSYPSLLSYEHEPLPVQLLAYLETHRLTPSSSTSSRCVEHSFGRQHAGAHDARHIIEFAHDYREVARG